MAENETVTHLANLGDNQVGGSKGNAPHPKQLYLDQSAVSHLVANNQDWKKSNLGQTILEFQNAGIIEVWASPQNVVELALCSDLSLRQTIAMCLEELTQGRRMYPSWEFIALKDYLTSIAAHWSDHQVNFPLFTDLAGLSQRLYSGGLAHMAALRDYDVSAAHDHIVRPKLLSQLQHLEIMMTPREKLQNLLGRSKQSSEQMNGPSENYEDLTVESLRLKCAELSQKLLGTYRNKSAAQQYEKNRQALIDQRTGPLAFLGLYAALKDYWNVLRSIKFQSIIEEWDKPFPGAEQLEAKIELPDALKERASESKMTYADHVDVLYLIAERHHRLLPVPNLMMDVVMREIEKAIKSNVPPTEGLTIDMDHATVLYFCDIFVTHDSKLLDTLKKWATDDPSEIEAPKCCVSDAGEIRRWLKRIAMT